MKFQGRQLQEGLRGEDTWADQLMDFLPLAEFRRYMARYDGDYKVRGVSRLDQFVYLAFS